MLRDIADQLLESAVGESWARCPWNDRIPLSVTAQRLRQILHAAVERGYGLGLLRAAAIDAQESDELDDTKE